MINKGVRKVLIPLYCDSVASVEKWKNGKIKETIAEKYAKVGEFLDVTIKFEMIAYE